MQRTYTFGVTRRDLKSRILIALGGLTVAAMGLVWLLARSHVIAPVGPSVVPTGTILGIVSFAYGSTMRGGIG